MIMRRRVHGSVLAAAAAALVIGPGAATVLAATALTITVSGGGHVTGTSPSAIFATKRVHLTCTSSKVSGSIPNGTTTGGSPVKIGTLGSFSVSGCGPGVVRVTASKLPYALQADSATDGAGQTDVRIPGVRIAWSTTGCSFTVSGSAPGYFTSSTHNLALTPTLPVKPLERSQLTIGGVTGCAGLLRNGDHATYQATYTIGRLTITSS
jgi:hypothetical protein